MEIINPIIWPYALTSEEIVVIESLSPRMREHISQISQRLIDLENALTEQLLKQGYAFRGRCDGVPEDIERAFNALGICTEEHKATLEKEK